MRISDWSSDVCSSDLNGEPEGRQDGRCRAVEWRPIKRIFEARKNLDRRRADVRHARSEAATGIGFRAWPAGRGGREVRGILAFCASLTLMLTAPAYAETIAKLGQASVRERVGR